MYVLSAPNFQISAANFILQGDSATSLKFDAASAPLCSSESLQQTLDYIISAPASALARPRSSAPSIKRAARCRITSAFAVAAADLVRVVGANVFVVGGCNVFFVISSNVKFKSHLRNEDRQIIRPRHTRCVVVFVAAFDARGKCAAASKR